LRVIIFPKVNICGKNLITLFKGLLLSAAKIKNSYFQLLYFTFTPLLKFMIKNFLLTLLFISFITLKGFSQMTIGASTVPNENSVLELVSPLGNQGFVLPQVSLTGPALTNPAPLKKKLLYLPWFIIPTADLVQV
jgi:hypothetical protein